MLIDVYHHRHWDQINGCSIIIPRFSTEARIIKSGGEIMPETKRQIDERLLDSDGNAIIQLNSEDWKILRELADRNNGKAMISGNKDRRHLDQLLKYKLIISRAVNISDVEYEITALGLLALEKLG